MTIYRSEAVAIPVGDRVLAKLAALFRYGYAAGHLDLEDVLGHKPTDQDIAEHFAAFLAGAGSPSRTTP